MELRDLFVMAIQGEIEGRELYRAASERTTDRKARQVFLNLSNEENSHVEALNAIAEKMLKGEKVDVPQLAPIEKFDDAQSPIFTPEFKQAIKDRHFEVSTLRIGMKLESESARFYREFADKVENPEVKDFLLYLSRWETSHYEKFKQQMGILEEHYMTQNSLFRF
ncbi:MAG: ferritin family protein [Spirochaetaceae bacterium]|nr:ferritin family protein [Spirochaetaceae bacterium]